MEGTCNVLYGSWAGIWSSLDGPSEAGRPKEKHALLPADVFHSSKATSPGARERETGGQGLSVAGWMAGGVSSPLVRPVSLVSEKGFP